MRAGAPGPRRRPRWLLAVVLGALAGVLAVAPLRAQESDEVSPLVVWHAPPSCPSRAVLEAEIERILGRRPTGGPHADVTITARAGRHAALLELGQDGADRRRRRIEGASCEAVLRAAALIIALEIDPDALSFGGDEPTEAIPEVEPEPLPGELEGAVDLSRAVSPDPARALASPFAPGVSRGPVEPDFRFFGGAGLALDAGAMPGLAPGAWFSAFARIAGWLELGLELRFLPAQRARLAPRPQLGADVSLLAGRVRAALGIVVARIDVVSLELAPLAALELGAVSAEAVGLTTPLSSSSIWWALAVGLELRAFLLDVVGVFVRGELEVTLRRAGFFVEGYSSPVFRAADAGFVGITGLLLRT